MIRFRMHLSWTDFDTERPREGEYWFEVEGDEIVDSDAPESLLKSSRCVDQVIDRAEELRRAVG